MLIGAGANAKELQKPLDQLDKYNATVGIGVDEDPNETWTIIGEGSLRDDIVTGYYWLSSFYEFPVTIAKSDQYEGRYRVYDPYQNFPMGNLAALPSHDHYFTIDASDPTHVWIEKGCLGVNLSNPAVDDWEFVIWSIADHEYNDVSGNWEDVEKEYGEVWGVLEDGCIRFPQRNSLLVHYFQPKRILDESTGQYVIDPSGEWIIPSDGWKYCNGNGMFRVKLPGAPDYDVNLFEGKHTTGANPVLNFSMTWGKDVAWAQIGIVEGTDAAALAEYLSKGNGTKIDNSGADQFGNINFTVPYTKDGQFTIVVVPFNADGEPKLAQSLTTDISLDETEWRKCGQVDYTEAVFASCELTKTDVLNWLNPQIETFKSDIEVNMLHKGKFRLVDPYKNYSNAMEYDTEKRHYMVIDATDPDCVHIEYTEDDLGFDIGFGPMYIWSRANRDMVRDGKTKEWVKQAGHFGKLDLDNGQITFPKDMLFIQFPKYQPTNYYYANENGKFLVQLTADVMEAYEEAQKEQGVNTISIEAPATPELFTISGMKVTNGNAAPGIYIERCGDRTRKVIIK